MAHHVELAFSRDGIHYDRRYREPFTQRGARSEFDCNSIYGRSPLLHGDRILFFYHGLSYRSPETLLALGDKAKGAVGLATLPLDGFVSMDGVGGALSRDVAPYSEMVTRSFGFTGSRLSLNVSAALQGPGPVELRVEVLEPNHHRIDGFQFDDADPITESGQSHVVSWKGSPDLSALVGRAIKLRFYFKNCKLYSFPVQLGPLDEPRQIGVNIRVRPTGIGLVGPLDTPFPGRTTRVERSECGQHRLVRQPEGVQLCVGQLEAHPDGPVCIDRALWPR